MYLVSLIIPCYNEAKSLPALVERCKLLTEKANMEVILVNNGSVDASSQILTTLLTEQPHVRAVHIDKNQGYGHGILTGLTAGNGTFLAWTHADLQTDPLDLLKAVDLIQQSSKPEQLFIKGRRSGRPLADIFFMVCMSVFETFLLRRCLWDINAQPNVFHRHFFESWKNPPNDFSLDLYAYYQAKVSKLSVKRIPVVFSVRQHGISHWNVDWKSKLKFIKRTINYSFNLTRSLKKT